MDQSTDHVLASSDKKERAFRAEIRQLERKIELVTRFRAFAADHDITEFKVGVCLPHQPDHDSRSTVELYWPANSSGRSARGAYAFIELAERLSPFDMGLYFRPNLTVRLYLLLAPEHEMELYLELPYELGRAVNRKVGAAGTVACGLTHGHFPGNSTGDAPPLMLGSPAKLRALIDTVNEDKA